MRIAIVTAACALALAVAGPAQAAKGTYAGTAGGTGKIALDVKVKHNLVTKITALRGTGLPSTCATSGAGVPVNFDLTVRIPISSQSGKFSGSYTQPDYPANVSTISGKVKHKRISGTITVVFHYPAEGAYPEEDCNSGPLPFTGKFGAPDETATTTRPARLTP